MLSRPRGPSRASRFKGLSIDSNVAASHDLSSPYTGPPFSPNSGRTPKVEEDLSHVDPDDLFIRFSVSEVKNIQNKFRREADGKQEELRLMVGERYRDLLQASTSIMTISGASNRVVALLHDMKEACLPDEPAGPQPVQKPKLQHQEDTQLNVLQSLSAHMKLLLDAPEHLWLFLEQRKFLHAAWLFLLSRVVYRALVNADSDGEDNMWQSQGIDVLEQFPLVQRQWESISHFRANISHKATHSLREHGMSADDTCSTLVTLHLLESLPLNDTLSHLLTQRTRTLNALLAKDSALGYELRQQEERKKYAVADVSDVLSSVLDVLSSTVGVARAIFSSSASSPSLIERRLRDIQSAGSPTEPMPTNTVESLNTPVILAGLPSSTHLLTLPPSIQSYRPYIDLDASAPAEIPDLEARVHDWFARGVEGVERRVGAWFATLGTVTDIWRVRARVLQRAGALADADRAKLGALLDDACKKRAIEVWDVKFGEMEKKLRDGLREVLDALRKGGPGVQQDIAPTEHIFASHPPPSLSLVGANPALAVSSFQSYKAALKQKLSGRSPLLHGLLQDMEWLAAREKKDLEVLLSKQYDDPLAQEMHALYDPVVYAACQRSLAVLSIALGDEESRDANALDGVLFIGRLCHELTTSSTFVSDLHLSPTSKSEFGVQLADVHSRTLSKWRRSAVDAATALYSVPVAKSSKTHKFSLPSQPSGGVIEALSSLVSATQRLGLARQYLEDLRPVQSALTEFVDKISEGVESTSASRQWSPQLAQVLWDLEFVLRISNVGAHHDGRHQQNGSTDAAHRLHDELQAAIPKSTRAQWHTHVEATVPQQLCRTQILLAPLLSLSAWDRLTSLETTRTPLLRLGAPQAAQDARVETGTSHVPRFVLLAS
ncbi:hypothetical protein AURDEDRAFT_149495 [Auricularia subglabra TFB-10046 SS5]|nr:hypothetical protein AURDEDRAFT_149495 [Auricularia subglabra TFB-10046 SS5]